MYVKVRFEYSNRVTLTQTKCSNPPQERVCVPQSYTPAVLAEVMLYTQSWFGAMSLGSVKMKVQNCLVSLDSKQTWLCTIYPLSRFMK